MANPAKAYLTTQVETTSQGELLIMLYEAAIKFLRRAIIEIENKDYAKKGIYISKSLAIIHELMESLNKEKGGDITPRLASLYQFCTSHLVKANMRMDIKMIEEVINILDGIRSAYAQIVAQADGKIAPSKRTSPVATSPAPPEQSEQSETISQSNHHSEALQKPPLETPKKKEPLSSPKFRSGFNAAKMRAATAYNNNRS